VRHCFSPYCAKCLCASFESTSVFVKLANTAVLRPGEPRALFIPIESERNFYFFFDCFLREPVSSRHRVRGGFAARRSMSESAMAAVAFGNCGWGHAVVFKKTVSGRV
jgi:hypothetical protein